MSAGDDLRQRQLALAAALGGDASASDLARLGRAVRLRLNLSQTAFARRYGFTVGFVRDVEQDRASASHRTRMLLMAIAAEPDLMAQIARAAEPINALREITG